MIDFVEDMPCEMKQIFHPTDFSPGSMAAFGHALKLSLAMVSDLTIMHVDSTKADPDFEDYPRVRATLSRWGILQEGATKEDLLALGVGVRKILARADNPLTSMLQFLSRKPTDLMVLATHPNDTLGQWLSAPVGPSMARKSRTMSLFVPDQCSGFVALDTGTVSMQRILIPVDHRPQPQAAVDAACKLVGALGVHDVRFELLYVGAKASMPSMRLPQREGWSWHQSVIEGVVAYEILEAVERFHPDLIVMATQWKHGFLDALLGSTTERVLRQAVCPLLAVPSG